MHVAIVYRYDVLPTYYDMMNSHCPVVVVSSSDECIHREKKQGRDGRKIFSLKKERIAQGKNE